MYSYDIQCDLWTTLWISTVNLLKLCVGAETVEDLTDWQKTARAKGADGLPRHVTRMWPKREEEILRGGSLYWVFKGVVLARQRDPAAGRGRPAATASAAARSCWTPR